jgi:hypothetical protein
LIPLIRGEDRTLDLIQQRLLATWAAKTALMLDLASEGSIVPTGFYYELRQLRRPLQGQAVWLGAYLGSSKAIWAEHRALHLGIPEEEPANGFVTTFNVFRCVFQVVGHFTKGGATINDARLLSLGLSRIWPPNLEAIAWPRDGLAFNDEALRLLASSIKD